MICCLTPVQAPDMAINSTCHTERKQPPHVLPFAQLHTKLTILQGDSTLLRKEKGGCDARFQS